jgi:hypothetical protein
MGNKANILTLRPSHQLKYSRLDLNEFSYQYSLLKLFDFLFTKKRLFLTNSNIFLVENKIFLTFYVFFRVAKLFKFLKLKKKLILKKMPVLKNLKKNISTLFNSFKLFKKNLIIFTIINLNFFLKKKKKKISLFFKLLKRDGLKLFPRRFKFFLDFLQISILFLKQKVQVTFLIKIFAEIFRILQKKMHSKFFSFISKYFQLLITESGYTYTNSKKRFNLKGIKIAINGKLKGKPRSSTYIQTIGSVPAQTINYHIEYAKTHAFTIYGVFGIKLWVYR